MKRNINCCTVITCGTWYEISSPKGCILSMGGCEKDMTPRQVYDMVFPRPEGDGKLLENVTLFFVDDLFGLCEVNAESAALDIGKCGFCQEGYKLTYKSPNESRHFDWPNRPRIIAADGFFTLPEYVLYKVESRGNTVIKTSKFFVTGKKLDAIAAYLDSVGISWREM